MLASRLEPLSLPLRRVVFGRALARLIAHEIYYVLAQTTGHPDSGVAKPWFSLNDLTIGRFDFNVWTLAHMRQTQSPTSVRGSDSEIR